MKTNNIYLKPNINTHSPAKKKSLSNGNTLYGGVCYDSFSIKTSLNSTVNFGTLRQNNIRALSEDTGFFRDLKTLNSAINVLNSNFEDGAEILDYACSNGEEALSLLALLGKNRNKFNIRAFDTSNSLIFDARNSNHYIFKGYWDDFLLQPSSLLDKDKRQAILAFHSIMKKDEPSREYMENTRLKYYPEAFYKVRDKYHDSIRYNVGCIENIDKVHAKKLVGAVFFRNAFYHVFRPESDNEYNYREMTGAEKIEKANEIIDKIDDTLAPGGIFVMGDIPSEHIFAADETVRNSDKIMLADLYKNVHFKIRELEYDSCVFKTSPIVKALQDKGYKPICTAKCCIGKTFYDYNPANIDVPTIWQKPKSKTLEN